MQKNKDNYTRLTHLENSSDTFHLRFQQLLKNTSFIGFARKSGISDKSIRDYFYGRTVPNIQKVREIAELLECNPSWLAFGIGSQEKIAVYPKTDNPERLIASEPSTSNLLNSYANLIDKEDIFFVSDTILKQKLFELIAQYPILSSLPDNLEGLFTKKKLNIPFSLKFIQNEFKCEPDQLFSYQVTSDSMSPRINTHDIIIVNTHQSAFVEGVYLLLMNDTLVLRHVQQMIGNKFKFSCINTSYSTEIVDGENLNRLFFVLGKVIWVGNKIT
ncbi:LexA family transcriptional regulator [Thorsellia kenyensis]|uniref:Helix-turn-helix transcriptional regulator n=1 Tax=Thorsellia kenyensis TaxID=1549888 RepID=A0ABV6CCK6_9GAMM